MEELQLIIEMIAKLPQTALWVLIGFWAYKVIIVGSIYGVIRYGIWALHSWLTKPKVSTVGDVVDGMGNVLGSKVELVSQLNRLRIGRGGTGYIHNTQIGWLREAIDDKIAKEGLK